MKDKNYVSKLENVIKQMLTPLKDIPFNLVIESLTRKKVIPFDFGDLQDKKLLDMLRQVAVKAGIKINQEGIKSRRANEVGNYIEPFVKEAMNELGLNADVPAGKSGKKKAVGYPDIIFFFNDKPNYLECKTYNKENIGTTQRSFYFSPSEDFKVIYDAHHFMLAYEVYPVGRTGDKNIYNCSHWKIISIENLLVDVKHEFNSDNRRLYSEEGGAQLLAEGEI